MLCCFLYSYAVCSGSLLDQFLQFSSKILIQVASIIVLIFGLILFLSENRFTIFLCYIVIGSFMLVNSSLFNSLGMEYINADIHLNYSWPGALALFLML